MRRGKLLRTTALGFLMIYTLYFYRSAENETISFRVSDPAIAFGMILAADDMGYVLNRIETAQPL